MAYTLSPARMTAPSSHPTRLMRVGSRLADWNRALWAPSAARAEQRRHAREPAGMSDHDVCSIGLQRIDIGAVLRGEPVDLNLPVDALPWRDRS
ncbi:hypothetical protein [Marivibrio sp.]|uniref:hypothetical protein n=1 Tax=Marivibrio sp. TaxID=2039719 RepID=UPI0032ECE2BA